MMTVSAELKRPVRHFLPAEYVLTDWSGLEPYFQDLESRPLETREALEKWLLDMSELEAVVSEDACWRQIRMSFRDFYWYMLVRVLQRSSSKRERFSVCV